MANRGEFLKFINGFRTTKDNFNIISIGGPNFPPGKFHVNPEKFPKFLDIYHKYIFTHKNYCYI